MAGEFRPHNLRLGTGSERDARDGVRVAVESDPSAASAAAAAAAIAAVDARRLTLPAARARRGGATTSEAFAGVAAAAFTGAGNPSAAPRSAAAAITGANAASAAA